MGGGGGALCVCVWGGGGGAGLCSLANYSVACEETQSNRVSDFRDFVCSLFPKAILFYFYFKYYLSTLQMVPCVQNPSYSFLPMVLKLLGPFALVCRCECGFGINSNLIFSLFTSFELSHFCPSILYALHMVRNG